MKKSKFTEEQMPSRYIKPIPARQSKKCAVKSAFASHVLRLEEKVRRAGGAGLRRLKQLEEENRKLKQLVADLQSSPTAFIARRLSACLVHAPIDSFLTTPNF